jgi:MGT family glycosyltransferase
MANLLFTAVPVVGHVKALIPVAAHLQKLGHNVSFNTGDAFRKDVEAAGLDFIPLIGKANFDITRMEECFPDRKNVEIGIPQLNYDMMRIFSDPIPDQYKGIQQIVAEKKIDAILADNTFFGIFPYLLGSDPSRPRIISCGHTATGLTTIDASHMTGPDPTPEGRVRNEESNRQWKEGLAPAQEHFNKVLNQCGVPGITSFFLDTAYSLPDLHLSFVTQKFDGPRSDKPKNFHYVGPTKILPQKEFSKPEWWNELDGSVPVVFVSQGTIANYDLNQLLVPTLEALAEEKVKVIATGGGSDVSLIKVPANARVVRYLPYDFILPKTDVFVTNAGLNGVLQALSLGIPMVAAGGSEDHPIIAGRLAGTGAGINLATGTPTREQIRTAVRAILSDEKYRKHALEMQQDIAQYDAMSSIAKSVESILAESLVSSR